MPLICTIWLKEALPSSTIITSCYKNSYTSIMSTRLTFQSRPTGSTTHCSRVAPRGSPPAQPLSPDTATARLPQERSTSRPHTPSSTKTPAAHTLKLLTLHTHVYNKNSNYIFNIKLHFQCNSRQCVSEKEVVHLQTWAHLRCTQGSHTEPLSSTSCSASLWAQAASSPPTHWPQTHTKM